MPHIPAAVQEQCPPIKGLNRIHQGKVRDTYELPTYPNKLLCVASDRVSVFDCVLNALIPSKGAVLTAMNHFWTKKLMPFYLTDFVASGAGIDMFLPTELRGNVELQKRATVVNKFQSPKYEDIVRFHLTGSGYSDYKKKGSVCGHRLPPGLIDGSRLPTPLYTPSSKATEGHDVNLDVDDVFAKLGVRHERAILMAAGIAYQYALSKDIILADTKLETFWTPKEIILIDEKFTPDSSRFWDLQEWENVHREGKLPPPIDKQLVRNYVKKELGEHGIDKPDPQTEAHLKVIEKIGLPQEIVHRTSAIYQYIFAFLSGKNLEIYQREEMGIAC